MLFLFLLLSLSLVSSQNTFPPLNLTSCETSLLSLFRGEIPHSGEILNYMAKSANNLGNYDECLALNDTQYCLLFLTSELVPLYAGWCVPGVCDGPALEKALDTFLRKNITDLFFGKNVAVRVSVSIGGIETSSNPYPLTTPKGIPKINASCVNNNKSILTTGALVVIFFIFLFTLATLIASIMDYYLPVVEVEQIVHKPIKYDHEPSESDQSDISKNDGSLIPLKDLSNVSDSEIENSELEELEQESTPPRSPLVREKFGAKLLLSFSVLHNLKSLSAKERSTETQFLNGIRVLSMFYIILGHTNAFMISVPVLDLYHFVIHIFKSLSFQIITGGFFAVDTFYFLSGMLVSLTLIDFLKKEKKVNWILVYFHRWWRLTPLYFLTIWIFTYLTPYLVNGPLSHSSGQIFAPSIVNCEQYWWTDPLYINNFIPWDDPMAHGCIVWGWYLANDMQFFIITPAFIVLYLKNKKIGIMTALSLFVVSLLAVGVYIGINDLSVGDSSWFNYYYVKPWSRVGPYFIGVALAILWKEKGQVKISVPFRLLAYVCASILLLTTVFGTYTNVDLQWKLPEKILYHTFSRTGFVLGLGILSYLMLNNYADFIRALLSLHIWTPLARLSYGAYLLHPVIMLATYISTRTALSWDIWSVTIHYCSFIVLSYSLSLFFWLTFEKPMLNLEKEVITRIKGSPVVV